MDAPHSECPLTPCIRLLSSAWTLEIIYYLRQGTLHYGALRRSLGRVSNKVLTSRLRELEKNQLIVRNTLPTKPPQVEYSLTYAGRELLPIIDAFSKVSEKLRSQYGLL